MLFGAAYKELLSGIEGNVDGFDGVTIAEFDADMKIFAVLWCDRLRCYCMIKHYNRRGKQNLKRISRCDKIKKN